MRIRLREPAGQATLTLSDGATVSELQALISQKTSLSSFDLKHGYPPTPLALDTYAGDTKLADTGIKFDGEQLIVSRTQVASQTALSQTQETPTPARPSATASTPTTFTSTAPISQAATSSGFSLEGVGQSPPTKTSAAASTSNKPSSHSKQESKAASDSPEFPVPSHGATMVMRVMPDDNSCLFRAFNTAFFGSGMDNMFELRSVIAQYIQAHPEIYSEAILGRKRDEYCSWIQTEETWGGSIELDILSKHFDVEICSIDVKALRVDRYNEGKPQRCILVYSGIHYDVLALSPSDAPYKQAYAPPDFDTKIFDAFDEVVIQTAIEFCRVLKGQDYYTDTGAFRVRCNVCGFTATGENGLVKHTTETGHADFGQVEE